MSKPLRRAGRLTQSLLLRLGRQADARAIKAALKTELAEFRADSPSWVPVEAGGHTEWFAAMHFARAEERLRSALLLADSLRDWLDAYSFFNLPLFADDPAVLSFVTDTARRRA